ncbi:TIGR00269 family protein [Methanobacterium sp.]|uniref:TIGR00269 family protein n=1 Tax=Methanobacterium sp. TaxID=2164 RepID=UPI002AB8E117|nr:TIGR00269 family protein [Methanobacterium sp.]MDY9924405.1 TIGR00269 family protein [Methanobacterium sp.]
MDVCHKCGNPQIIIKRKQSGQMLCQECFIKSIQEKVLKDIRKQNLVEKGDKVLVALSGGKDSVMLLDILNNLRKRRIIDLVAVTIDEGIYDYREDGVNIAAENAELLGVKHRIVSFKDYLGHTLDEIMADTGDRNACTYCGVFRRWILNQVAREEGASRIATGHNLDDEAQSILMNYLEGNIQNLTRIGVRSESSYEGFTVKIKPLREIPEKETALYVVARDLPVHLAGCPYAGDSFRAKVRDFLKEISLDHPTIMYSTLRGFDKIKPVLKREFSKKSSMGICEDCGEPSASRICKACSFRRLWD